MKTEKAEEFLRESMKSDDQGAMEQDYPILFQKIASVMEEYASQGTKESIVKGMPNAGITVLLPPYYELDDVETEKEAVCKHETIKMHIDGLGECVRCGSKMEKVWVEIK